MQFHIDQDTGTAIAGWLVPDNPAFTPEIVISVPGQDERKLEANVLRTDLKDIGLHATGMAGFLVDDRSWQASAAPMTSKSATPQRKFPFFAAFGHSITFRANCFSTRSMRCRKCRLNLHSPGISH